MNISYSNNLVQNKMQFISAGQREHRRPLRTVSVLSWSLVPTNMDFHQQISQESKNIIPDLGWAWAQTWQHFQRQPEDYRTVYILLFPGRTSPWLPATWFPLKVSMLELIPPIYLYFGTCSATSLYPAFPSWPLMSTIQTLSWFCVVNSAVVKRSTVIIKVYYISKNN